MEQKSIKVAILDNSIDPEVYKPVEHWSAFLQVAWQAYRATEGQFPSIADGFTHVILTGSEASIMEREPWVDEEVVFIQEVAAAGLPVLGSCYGHQLLALALLGPSHVRRCTAPEMGWLFIRIAETCSLLGEGEGFYAFTLHYDEVVDVNESFQISASTPECAIHAMQHRSLPIWGIQSHPEIDIPAGKQLFQNLVTADPARRHLYEAALSTVPHDSGRIESVVHQFLKAGPKRR